MCFEGHFTISYQTLYKTLYGKGNETSIGSPGRIEKSLLNDAIYYTNVLKNSISLLPKNNNDMLGQASL